MFGVCEVPEGLKHCVARQPLHSISYIDICHGISETVMR